MLIVQGDAFNASRLSTTLAAVITSNTALAGVAGNVFLPTVSSGLDRDSVVNVTALVTVDKADLDEPVAHLPDHLMAAVDDGLRLVLDL